MGRRMAWEPPRESDFARRGLSAGLEFGSALRRSGGSWETRRAGVRLEEIRRLIDAAGGFTGYPEVAVAEADEATTAALRAQGRATRVVAQGALQRRYADALRTATHQVGSQLWERHNLTLAQFDLRDVTAGLPRTPRMDVDLDGGLERLPRVLEEAVREMASHTVADGSGRASEMAAAYAGAFARQLGIHYSPAGGDRLHAFPMPDIAVTHEHAPAPDADEVKRALLNQPAAADAGRRAVADYMKMLRLFGHTIPYDELSADNRVIPLMDTISDADMTMAHIVDAAAGALGMERVQVLSATRDEQLALRKARQVARFVPQDVLTSEFRDVHNEVADRVIDAVQTQGEGLRIDRQRITTGRFPFNGVIIDRENLAGDIDQVACTMQGTVDAIARGRGEPADRAREMGVAYAASFSNSFGLGASYTPVELGGPEAVDLPALPTVSESWLRDQADLDDIVKLGQASRNESSVEEDEVADGPDGLPDLGDEGWYDEFDL